jgi:hypothetical protein
MYLFHKQAKICQQHNTVTKIQNDEGKTLEDYEQIKEVAFQHYKAMFTEDE